MKNFEFKKGILMLLVATFVALFTACFDDVSASGGDSGEEEAPSLPAVEQPLVSLQTGKNAFGRAITAIKVQSQDNGTVIEKAVVNRGNCRINNAYEKVIKDKEAYRQFVLNHLKASTEWANFVSKGLATTGHDFKNKNGKKVSIRGVISAEEYEALDTESQAFFKSVYPTNPIAFGNSFYIGQSCSEKQILEVTLTINGKDFTYKFEHY